MQSALLFVTTRHFYATIIQVAVSYNHTSFLLYEWVGVYAMQYMHENKTT